MHRSFRLMKNCLAGGLLATGLTACSSLSADVTDLEVASLGSDLRSTLAKPAEPIKGPLSVDSAVTHAVKNNLNLRARELEVAVAIAGLRAESTGMLPALVSQSDYYRYSRLDLILPP